MTSVESDFVKQISSFFSFTFNSSVEVHIPSTGFTVNLEFETNAIPPHRIQHHPSIHLFLLMPFRE